MTKLETTYDDVHEMARLLNAKGRGDSVKVPKDRLWRLFRDHSRLVQMTRGQITGDT